MDGVDEISKNVDALLVINNERLREIYQDLSVINAFAKADDTLCNAARSIAEIITMHGIINLDFNDVKTVLKDGGVAIMSSGYGQGENRVTKAIEDALHSPLLNNNDIYKSKKILLRISFCAESDTDTLMMEEMNEVHEFMAKVSNEDVETKWGLSSDSTLKDKVKVTILATGFGVQDIDSPEMDERNKRATIEEQTRLAEKAEEDARKDERRKMIYGPDKSGPAIRRTNYIFYFKEEDLDNDDIISMVETTPTFSRSKETYNQIKSKSEDINIDTTSSNPAVISF